MRKRQRDSRDQSNHKQSNGKSFTQSNKRSNKQSIAPPLSLIPAQPIEIDTVDASSLSSHEFFNQYIGPRKPCIIANESLSELTNLRSLWSNDRLIEHAGDAIIQAEKRANNQTIKRFGLGNKVKMEFSSFVKHIEQGNDDMYMTTQYIDDKSDDQPNKQSNNESSNHSEVDLSPESRYLVAPPLLSLITDMPLRPRLFDCLIGHQINMWFGATLKESNTQSDKQSGYQSISSGLHHDYHDNLYVLLRGRKRITLIEPKYASHLRTVGTVKRIHPNGLICYDNETHADGTDDHERATQRRMLIEEQIQHVESKLSAAQNKSETSSLTTELRDLESQLDDVLDQLMDGDASDEGFDGFVDDFVDSDDEQPQKAKSKPVAVADEGDPPNFCKLNSSTIPPSIPRMTVELRAPAMLYIPASYFHEVFSSNSDGDDAIDSDPKYDGHLALNYWFMPPDRLNDPKQPYEQQELWSRRWERQKEQLENEKIRVIAMREQKDNGLKNSGVSSAEVITNPVHVPSVTSQIPIKKKTGFVLGKRRS